MTDKIEIRIVKSNAPCECMICPNCGAHELQDCANKNNIPAKDWRWNIRPFKVDDWSHCLKCDKWFDINGNFEDD